MDSTDLKTPALTPEASNESLEPPASSELAPVPLDTAPALPEAADPAALTSTPNELVVASPESPVEVPADPAAECAVAIVEAEGGGGSMLEPGGDSGESETPEPAPAEVTFEQLGLDSAILSSLASLGFTRCTPIQGQTLPHTLKGVDLIGQAQTGTGKTAAFLLTLLQRFARNPIPLEERFASEPRALVVAPTRELALQIEKDAKQLASDMKLNILSVIGGTQLDKARARLRDEAIDVLIATPGRLLDHLTSRDIYLDQVEVLVLDEADRMLDMGFIPDVKRIVNATPRGRQTLLFSATFNQDIINLAKRWTRDPVEVMLAVEHVPAKSVEQRMYMVESSAKMKILLNLLRDSETRRAIIFCNRRDETRRLADELSKHRISNAMISGELPQAKRLKTLELFRAGRFKALVATDVAGRGLHINGITHVINYNLPDDPEDYVHRIGRTGRAGETGISISFACEDDAFLIPELEAYLGHKVELTQPEPELLK